MENQDGNKYGSLLRQAREQAKRTVRETARAITVSPSYLSRVETGINPPMTSSKTVDAARYLRVDPLPLLAAAIERRAEARLPLAGASRQRVDFAIRLEARWVDGSLSPADIDALRRVLDGEE